MSHYAWLNLASVTPPFDYMAIRYLRSEGHTVDYFGSLTKYNGEFVEALEDECKKVYLKSVSGSVANKAIGVLNYILLWLSLWLRKKDYDYVVLSFPLLPLVDRFFANLLAKKLVYLVHNAKPHNYKQAHTPTRQLLDICSEAWFASEFTYQESCSLYSQVLLNKNTSILQHGCIPTLPREKQADFASASNANAMVIGNIKPYKGVENMQLYDLTHIKSLGIQSFTIAGKWDVVMRDMQQQLNASGYCIIDRFLDNAEFSSLFKANRIVVFPYNQASQSGVFYNAMFYGCVPICSNVGEMSELLVKNDLKGLVFEVDDPQSLYQAFEFVLKNRKEITSKLELVRQNCEFQLIQRVKVNTK
jgi:glycosyltransferase involved in cell wall biosynthesis